MKKIVITVIVLLILGGGGTYWWYSARAATPTTAAVQTGTVQRGLLRIVVATTGKVVSNRDVDIKCRASGEVNYLPYDVSDPVKANEVLMRLETKDEDQAIQRAQAAVANSQARLAQARQNLPIAEANLVTDRYRAEANLLSAQAKQKDAHTKFNRIRDLLAKKLAAQEDADTAETTAAQADADLKTAEAQMEALKAEELGIDLKKQDIRAAEADAASDQVNLDIQKQQLDYCTVYAPPFDTVVSARTVQIGTLIQSSISNVSGGTAVLTLSDLSHMFVYATVDESDIGRIQVGQKVNVTADSYPGMQFDGSVVRIAAKGVNTSNVVTFEVRIEVSSRNKRLLKPEMTANVEIVNTEKPDVLLVPSQAVIRKRSAKGGDKSAAAPATQVAEDPAAGTEPAASQPGTEPAARGGGKQGGMGGMAGFRNRPTPATVTVQKSDGTTETVDIVVGPDDGTNYEVISGLTEGQTVVLNKSGADSKWRQAGTPPGGGMGGPGGGRRPPM